MGDGWLRCVTDANLWIDLLYGEMAASAPNLISRNLGAILNHYAPPSVEDEQKSPDFLAVKEKIEANAASEKARLEEIEPLIAIIEDQLSICNKATNEQPKMDEPIKHFDAVVGRADVGGAV
jgi:hypothetical protein